MRDIEVDAGRVRQTVRALRTRRARETRPLVDLVQLLAAQEELADRVRATLAESARRLPILAEADALESRFGESGWPDRQRLLDEAFQRDPVVGTRRWISSWADAILAGRMDAATRLLSAPFPFPRHLSWLLDRCVAGQDAIISKSAVRWLNISGYLTAGADLAGEPSLDHRQRAGLLILEARLRAVDEIINSEESGADELLDDAASLDPDAVGPIRAARDMVARLRRERAAATDDEFATTGPGGEDPMIVAPPPDSASAGEPQTPMPGPEPAWNDLPNVVEWLELKRETDKSREILMDAQRAVAALPSVIGASGQLYALVEPLLFELGLAVCERLRRDGLLDDAIDMLPPAEGLPAQLAAERAKVLAAMSDDAGEKPTIQAERQFEAGDAALDAGRIEEAISAYEVALTLDPQHARAIVGLADALRMSMASSTLAQARVTLNRALLLCESLTPSTAANVELVLGLAVESGIALRLGESVQPERTEMLWRAVVTAGRSIALGDNGFGWLALANAMHSLSLTRTSELTARIAGELSADPGSVFYLLNEGLVWSGRYDESIERLQAPDTIERFGEAWAYASLAQTELFAGRLDEALKHVNQAIEIDPDNDWTRRLRAEILTVQGGASRALADWEATWKRIRLDEFYGLAEAAWAALGQGLLPTARELASELVDVERVSVDDGDGHAVLGIASLLLGDEAGWDDLEAAAGVADTGNIGYMERRIRAILGPRAEESDRLRLAFEQRARELKRLDDVSDLEKVATEMGRVLDRFRGDSPGDRLAAAGARLTRALYYYRAGHPAGPPELRALAEEMDWPEVGVLADLPPTTEPPAAEPEVEPGADQTDEPPMSAHNIEIPVEPDEAKFDIWYRYLPDLAAIATYRRRRFNRPEIVVDEDLPPNEYRIRRPHRRLLVGTVSADLLYCRREWLPSLPERARDAATDVPQMPELVALPVTASDDTVIGAVTWEPMEFVARRATGILGQPGRGHEPASSTL